MIILKGEMVRHIANIGENRNAYRILVGVEGQGPLGRPRCRLGDNIKNGLCVDWLPLSSNTD
jgi:hypothetical protein